MSEDRVVMVTGAAGALGRAVCDYFLLEGARLIALDYSNELLAEAFPSQQSPHLYLAADLTSRESCGQVIAGAVAKTGRIDVLCNVAGGFLMGEAVHETSDQTWDLLFNLNARSIVNTGAAVVPVMQGQGRGRIINVAAGAARQGMAQMGVYTASKAAVMRLTEAMSAELCEQGINVNCIMPSMIDTPRNRADMPDADYSRWVPPAQLASVIGFLASDAAVAVHGAAIPVNGLS